MRIKIDHVLTKIFQVPIKREMSFNEHSRITLATKYSTQTHTHAQLDLRVCHISPWVHCLTQQYIQCKYALPFPNLELHICLLEVGKKGKALVRVKTPLSELRVPFEEKFELCFHLQIFFIKTPSMLHSWVVMPGCLSRSTFQPLKATWQIIQKPIGMRNDME